MNWCILIPLLVGLISAILGYLLGRLLGGGKDEINSLKQKIENLETELNACNKSKSALKSETNDLIVWKDKVSSLEGELNKSKKSNLTLTADLAACRQSKNRLETDLTSAKNSLTSSLAAATLIPFNGDAAKAVFGKKIKQDDLKLVEGIGPKIEGLFHNFDIKTWKALSEASVEKCQEVLNSGGDRYKIHNPGTWPKQAQLAYEGKWAELLKWQDELDGGKA